MELRTHLLRNLVESLTLTWKTVRSNSNFNFSLIVGHEIFAINQTSRIVSPIDDVVVYKSCEKIICLSWVIKLMKMQVTQQWYVLAYETFSPARPWFLSDPTCQWQRLKEWRPWWGDHFGKFPNSCFSRYSRMLQNLNINFDSNLAVFTYMTCVLFRYVNKLTTFKVLFFTEIFGRIARWIWHDDFVREMNSSIFDENISPHNPGSVSGVNRLDKY